MPRSPTMELNDPGTKSMSETDVTDSPTAPPGVRCSDIVLRQWCIEKAIQWSGRPDDQTQTDEMIDQAALIERYVTTGKHSQMLEIGLLQSAIEEAERLTPNVGQAKAKAVCDYIAGCCGLPQNEKADLPPR